jgi:hypothetical protein
MPDFGRFSDALARRGYDNIKTVNVYKFMAIPGDVGPQDSPVTRLAKAAPNYYKKRAFSCVAIAPGNRDRRAECWYGRLMLLFRLSTSESAPAFALVRYWKQDNVNPTCSETGFPRLRWDVSGGGIHVEEIATIHRVVHVVPFWDNSNLWLVNTDYR